MCDSTAPLILKKTLNICQRLFVFLSLLENRCPPVLFLLGPLGVNLLLDHLELFLLILVKFTKDAFQEICIFLTLTMATLGPIVLKNSVDIGLIPKKTCKRCQQCRTTLLQVNMEEGSKVVQVSKDEL